LLSKRRVKSGKMNGKTLIRNTGPHFYGDLVQNVGLNKIARIKKRKKERKFDEALEDEVWLLFKNMGFIEMNKNRNFKIQAGSFSKQIDVIAKDNNHVFVIECKAQAKESPKPLRKDIHEILNLRNDIKESIKNYYKEGKLKVSFLLITRNIIWNPIDEEFASQQDDFFFWKEADFEAYNGLTEQLGNCAKFQMYSILFLGKKIYEVGKIEVPAIHGGKGKKKYYCFIIQPKKLFPIAYIHRREKSNPKELSGAYQRMVKKGRIRNINKFIERGGFFPNNIIINFTRRPIFETKAEVGDIVYGILKFPPYYGAAWIIDGQHRLYGYAKSEKAETDTLPVVAFESLKIKDQANLFVDINKEQKAVSPSLLWDLFPDIYDGSEEEGQQILRAISLIAKKINSDSDSILCDHIKIPSVVTKDKEETNLTLENICRAIKENKLINEKEGLLYEKDYDYTVNFASEITKAYFKIIAKSFPQDWRKGKRGLLRTNVGIRIFFIIFRQLLRYLKYEGLEKIYRKKDLSEFESKTEEILGPVLTKLKEMEDTGRDKIRSGTAKGLIKRNAQMLIWDLKEEFNFGLELWRKGGWTPSVPKEESDKDIRSLLEDTEKSLRDFIMKELEKEYGGGWWRQGIPKGVKDNIKEKIEIQISREAWRRDELHSLAPERKFKGFTDTSHLREVIKFTINWKLFENIFIKDKEYTMAQFKSFEFVRHKYQHFVEHECDEISKNLGYWGMKWIRRCIGLNRVERGVQ